ncbi:nucleotidyltransferase [Eubacteriales bacterium OttesenSCG-928-K08]|nr:nucleotidyltransferase [Eubacteriales bacterium OttesenSCG-928-K08]
MKKLTLVILAAGMSSRYGSLKQIVPVDEYGNLLIDYSIFDALSAGFSRVLFIIKHEFEKEFRELIGDRIAKQAQVDYAFQELSMLPEGFSLPQGRTKPWGTTHALLCCKGQLNEPFAVINADDYYGPDAYVELANYLNAPRGKNEHTMVGYSVKNTLSGHGALTRGLCEIDEHGYLLSIDELRGVSKLGDGGVYERNGERIVLEPDAPISMNIWGFHPDIMPLIEDGFPRFLERALEENPLTCEYLLPTTMCGFVESGAVRVRVLRASERWFGMTFKEDLPVVRAALRKLKDDGAYKEKLWN